jgi:hypothetical protein
LPIVKNDGGSSQPSSFDRLRMTLSEVEGSKLASSKPGRLQRQLSDPPSSRPPQAAFGFELTT